MLSAQMPSSERLRFSGRFAAAGYLLGIGLGGFFDGILLHQVLQWHHLLSLVDSPAVQDIRVQILADGMFHVLMYIVTAVGLVCLWKSRIEFSKAGAGKWLFGTMLLGFGLWNVADVVLFHWIMQIHRIRVDVPNPLFWDLLWLGLFGLIPLIAGRWTRSHSGNGGADHGKGGMDRSTSIVSAVTAAVIATGALAALPPSNSDTTLVLFGSDARPEQVFQAFDAADARVLWADRTGTVWAVKTTDRSDTMALYRHGAMLVTSSMVGLGCLSWLRT